MEDLDSFIKKNVLSMKVALIVEGMLPSVTIGIINPLNLLKKYYNISYDIFHIRNLLNGNNVIDFSIYNVAIFVRILSRESIEKVLIPFVNLKKKIIYILDDDFENLDPSTEIGQYFHKFNPKETIPLFCDYSDHVVVSSPTLYERYNQYSKIITIIPGFIDFEKINYTVKDKKLKDKSNVLTIGYASTDHNYTNLKPALSALKYILTKYKYKVKFELFFKDIPEELKNFSNVTSIPPIPDIEEFYKELSRRDWDIGIAPLEDNIFNRSKSNLKYREYASFGIAGIYTNVETYNTSVINNVTGILTNNTEEEWVRSLEFLINDDKKRKSIAMLSNFYIKENYNEWKVIQYYIDIFNSLRKKYKVLIVGDYFSTSIQIDAIRPFSIMKKMNILDYDVIHVYKIDYNTIHQYDVVIFYRVSDSLHLQALKNIKMRGIKTIYCWDDNFFLMPPESSLYNYCNSSDTKERIINILQSSDLVKSSTDSLLLESLKYNKNSIKCEGTFDFSLIPSYISRDTNRAIKIGYFGGPNRDKQFSHVFESLLEIANKYSNTTFEFFGFIPSNINDLVEECSKNSSISRVFTFPVVYPYEVAIKFLFQRQWDIGLSPLSINEFNKSKSNVKYRDYGACHIAGVYTDIVTYNTSVINGTTGLLVDNNKDSWFDAISLLIENKSLRDYITDNAYRDIKNNYNVTRSMEDWLHILKNTVGDII